MMASQDAVPQETGGFALQAVVIKITSEYRPGFSQVLSNAIAPGLAGKTVTVAGWIWASTPIQTTMPGLNIFRTASQSWTLEVPVKLNATPQFFAVHYKIPGEGRVIILMISPTSVSKNANKVMVYYKDLILAEGEYPTDQIPQFSNSAVEGGSWGGQPFTNLLSNASMQGVWPRFSDNLISIFNKTMGVSYTSYGLVDYILDFTKYSGYTLLTIENNFRTFWAKFGWGQVVLSGDKPYLLLGVVSLAGILGTGVVLILGRRKIPWGMIAFLCLAGGSSWAYTLLIGSVIKPLIQLGFITGARYAYPGIVPTALVLNTGWWGAGALAGQLITRKRRLPPMTGMLVFCGLFLCLDGYALFSILQYFR